MDDFDPYRNDGPIEYAVKTGDPSRGASIRDERIVLDDFVYGNEQGSKEGNSLITLALSIVFLVVALLSL